MSGRCIVPNDASGTCVRLRVRLVSGDGEALFDNELIDYLLARTMRWGVTRATT
jgi:hypothetical protein